MGVLVSTSLCVSLALEVYVNTLIHQMDSPSFVQREEAIRKTVSFGSLAIPALKRAAKDQRSPEARLRCKEALDSIYTVLPTRFPRFKKYPSIRYFGSLASAKATANPRSYAEWLKMFPKTRLPVQNYLGEVLASMVSKGIRGIEPERAATQMYIRDLLDAGMSRHAVQEFINDLAEAERRELMRTGQKVPPELNTPVKDVR